MIPNIFFNETLPKVQYFQNIWTEKRTRSIRVHLGIEKWEKHAFAVQICTAKPRFQKKKNIGVFCLK